MEGKQIVREKPLNVPAPLAVEGLERRSFLEVQGENLEDWGVDSRREMGSVRERCEAAWSGSPRPGREIEGIREGNWTEEFQKKERQEDWEASMRERLE